ncbi:tryptophan 2,3-dioxygenase family protein [Micromonospora sp. MW-13]|uniref:tryptophan 2,3-dioxygenase family protein n=1 Tax=Micromonospora sp. MW-13 TaxID=2094022 RepID=UPI000E43335A|nr:tryptophan 2,3-dioxygenase family protein [Micromonospora sp. MW-13]
MRFVRELTSWLSGGADPDSFPYLPVTAEFHRTGKHFVGKEFLALLDEARAHVAARAAGAGPAEPGPVRLLRDFLDVALDKWDGRYDYRSYLALRLLGLPCGDDGEDGGPVAGRAARRDRDRLLVRLVADALGFELAASAGATDLLPEQRPGPALVAKRHRLGVRAVAPALSRLGLTAGVDDPQPAGAAAALRALAAADRSAAEERALRLSMLPVYLSHDEYLFIRVLQAYECTFAGLADELRATIDALDAGRAAAAAQRLAYARDQLATAAPLFSLLASMQPESFRTFRAYTEGASAIQSRSYKLMESLCRTPEGSRLDSAAYRSVPEVRDRVRAGRPSVDAALQAAVRAGRLAGADRALVERRMREFAAAVLQWRRTHHRLAVRMLGERPGTGYTEGTPYLAEVRAIPVFTAVAADPDPADPSEPSGGCPE